MHIRPFLYPVIPPTTHRTTSFDKINNMTTTNQADQITVDIDVRGNEMVLEGED